MHFTLRTILAGAVSVLALFLSAPKAGAQVNAEQVLAIGRNVLSMEDYMLAIQYFNQAIKAKPYLADPYFFRAIAKLSLDDYKGAEQDCSLALERNKYKSEAYKVRGFARQHLGLDSLAVIDYDHGLEYNPIDKYFLYYKAVAETQLERYQKADTTFSILMRQYPKFDEGFSARGRFNMLRGDTLAALDDIESALRLSKSQINPYLMRAEILSKRAEWGKALEDMDEVVRLAPDEPDIYVNRAYMRYNNDDLFGAMSDYNYALDLDPANKAARFNRALLRFEVRDLKKAAEDFTEVLRTDPSNFHALYNRGLIWLELRQWAKAQKDFNAIASRYPRFYPVYYALSECRREQGDLRSAFAYMEKADDLVRRYVDNPEKNPLDRPTIDPGQANATSRRDSKNTGEEDDMAVMERFNQLVTSADVGETRLAYNERIKGRVQDRDLQVEPEPMYSLSFEAPAASLQAVSNSFRELDNLNQRRYLSSTLHLVSGSPTSADEEAINRTFKLADELSATITSRQPRPVDWLARGVAYTMLKNYPDAVADFDKALEATPDFAVALMGRGYARYMNAVSQRPEEGRDPALSQREVALAMADYDAALKLNPELFFAWFNKGCIYYAQGDYTSAMQCFSESIRLNPAQGQSYFNRGLCYLRAGNRLQAFADLSKAGELGVIPSYNILKRMK